MNDLDTLVRAAQAAFDAAPTPAELENAKARLLGKAGQLTELMKGLGALSVEQKKARGASINQAKQRIEGLCRRGVMHWRRASCRRNCRPRRWTSRCPVASAAGVDCTRFRARCERIEAIFASMGFDVADGPEIETDWYSFTALNNPENHPARSMQDTFYVD